jgi:hypothetical protein
VRHPPLQGTGSDHIYLGNQGFGAGSGWIKIGTFGTHTQTQIAGIHSSTSSGGIAVFVDSNGTLGTTTSSLRFKQNVHDMGDTSAMVQKLRPVVFTCREDVAPGGEQQYALIAEEVAEIAPDLMALGLDGKPYSVKYPVLAPLLLNEVQKQQRAIEAHERASEEQRVEIAKQQELILALAHRLAALESQNPGSER